MSNVNSPATLQTSASTTKGKKKSKKKKANGVKVEDVANEPTEIAAEDVIESGGRPEEVIGTKGDQDSIPAPTNVGKTSKVVENIDDAQVNGVDESTTKLDALVAERDSLRAEVSEIRKSLESIQEKHETEKGDLHDKLLESKKEKEAAETSYKNLLGKVNQIKAQLGERLKADAEDLDQARSTIKDLEEHNGSLAENNGSLEEKQALLRKENDEQLKEITILRDRVQKSQQNWTRERDDQLKNVAQAREELEAAKSAMQDWEVLAMEERSLRENLAERVSELEEQLSTHINAYREAVAERDDRSQEADGLRRDRDKIQTERKRELRELVENNQSQIEELSKQVKQSESLASAANSERDNLRIELERVLPYEKEVKEKNLLIGKLRHEAVILNDHLTKALRFLKKGNPEDNVDRQIVTNHLLQFLVLDRSDPKKFQILQLIAALLGWDEEQREQAGLARPASSNNNLRVPLSPFRRSPSQQSFSTDLWPNASMNSRESLAELWSDFLKREAQEGGETLVRQDEMPSSRRNVFEDELKSPKTT